MAGLAQAPAMPTYSYDASYSYDDRFGQLHLDGCVAGCDNAWLGDGECDEMCNVDQCQYDRGDCRWPQGECYNEADGSDYRGNVSATRSGLPCQLWSHQWPHAHTYAVSKFPDAGLGGHNFCRNPDGDPDGPWCFTMAEARWEYCDVIEPVVHPCLRPSPPQPPHPPPPSPPPPPTPYGAHPFTHGKGCAELDTEPQDNWADGFHVRVYVDGWRVDKTITLDFHESSASALFPNPAMRQACSNVRVVGLTATTATVVLMQRPVRMHCCELFGCALRGSRPERISVSCGTLTTLPPFPSPPPPPLKPPSPPPAHVFSPHARGCAEAASADDLRSVGLPSFATAASSTSASSSVLNPLANRVLKVCAPSSSVNLLLLSPPLPFARPPTCFLLLSIP